MVVGRVLKLCRGRRCVPATHLWILRNNLSPRPVRPRTFWLVVLVSSQATIPSAASWKIHEAFTKSVAFISGVGRDGRCCPRLLFWRTVLRVSWQLFQQEKACHCISITPVDVITLPASVEHGSPVSSVENVFPLFVSLGWGVQNESMIVTQGFKLASSSLRDIHVWLQSPWLLSDYEIHLLSASNGDHQYCALQHVYILIKR